MLNTYKDQKKARLDQGLPPLPLSPELTAEVTKLLEQNHDEAELLLDMLFEQVEPGVSKSAKVKAAWLEKVAMGVREGINSHSGLWWGLVVKLALPTMLFGPFLW